MASVIQSPSTSNDRSATSSRRSKAAGAFRTISEVAEELDVAQHVLRFWESKFPQVRPLKRGGGRRYYRPEDVDLLRRIRSLLYDEGYTIKGAQKLLKGQRRTPADKASRDNGSTAAAAAAMDEQEPSELENAHNPLDDHQRQILNVLRAELVQLRDRLRKLTS